MIDFYQVRVKQLLPHPYTFDSSIKKKHLVDTTDNPFAKYLGIIYEPKLMLFFTKSDICFYNLMF